MSEGAPHDALQVVRTAGIVLTTLGLISIAITLVWNALGEPPPPGSLAKLTGEVVDRGLITVPTRTSIERWLALDVVSDGESVRWVLPEYAEPLEAKLDTVAIGARVEGRALAEEKLLRWHDAPVRVQLDGRHGPGRGRLRLHFRPGRARGGAAARGGLAARAHRDGPASCARHFEPKSQPSARVSSASSCLRSWDV